MALYDVRCVSHGITEIVRRMSGDRPFTCAVCDGPAERFFVPGTLPGVRVEAMEDVGSERGGDFGNVNLGLPGENVSLGRDSTGKERFGYRPRVASETNGVKAREIAKANNLTSIDGTPLPHGRNGKTMNRFFSKFAGAVVAIALCLSALAPASATLNPTYALTYQAAGSPGQGKAIAGTITLGASDTYVAGGFTVTPALLGCSVIVNSFIANAPVSSLEINVSSSSGKRGHQVRHGDVGRIEHDRSRNNQGRHDSNRLHRKRRADRQHGDLRNARQPGNGRRRKRYVGRDGCRFNGRLHLCHDVHRHGDCRSSDEQRELRVGDSGSEHGDGSRNRGCRAHYSFYRDLHLGCRPWPL